MVIRLIFIKLKISPPQQGGLWWQKQLLKNDNRSNRKVN